MDDDDELAGLETFLREQITSYEHLEILLLLRREGGRAWPASAVASTLSTSQPAALAALEHLERCGLVEPATDGGERAFCARREPSKYQAELERIAQAYELDRTKLMKIMNRNAIERVRARAMQAFTQTGKKRGG
jgi:DNA-binding MarR family transcriptional regulator